MKFSRRNANEALGSLVTRVTYRDPDMRRCTAAVYRPTADASALRSGLLGGGECVCC